LRQCVIPRQLPIPSGRARLLDRRKPSISFIWIRLINHELTFGW
jgi:hypothetical protein